MRLAYRALLAYAERLSEEAKPSSFVERVKPLSQAEQYKEEGLPEEKAQARPTKTVQFADRAER